MIEFDYSELEGVIVRRFKTRTAFAKAVGKTITRVSLVLNNNAVLNQRDVMEWAETLGVEKDDIGHIFFTRKVHEKVTE